MSPSGYIRRRRTKTRGTTWHVRYRLGGRGAREVHDSVWTTKTHAANRLAVVMDALSKGHIIPPVGPVVPVEARTLRGLLEQYAADRHDVSDVQRRRYWHATNALGVLADRDPDTLRPADIRGWVTDLAGRKAPDTVRAYFGVMRAALDHAEVTPNPARHHTIRMPKARTDEVNPPSTREWMALRDTLPTRYRLAAMVLEGTGLRLEEAMRLTWGDVDLTGGRLRVAGTKSRAARRWVPLEPLLQRAVEGSCPLEDRGPDRPVLVGVSGNGLRHAMYQAARLAGVPTYSPHDLRHRYISLLVASGCPLPIVRQTAGHTTSRMTLDVYSHVMVDEDPGRLAEIRTAAMRVAGGNGPSDRDQAHA